MAQSRKQKAAPSKGAGGSAPKNLDQRKQLFNNGEVGPIAAIQLSAECITQVNGILFDLDTYHFRKSPFVDGGDKPEEAYRRTVSNWLKRHPVLHHAEVRLSGMGLHVILWVTPPIVFETAGDRMRWAAIVQAVQAALPVDANQPGITATTRATGSVNSKNGAIVKILARGKAVSAADVESLFDDMRSSPFKTVLNILAGTDRLSPCPFCKCEGTTLVARDYLGNCYGCGKVKLDALYDLVLRPRKPSGKVVSNAKSK